jgi:hypothetical protein
VAADRAHEFPVVPIVTEAAFTLGEPFVSAHGSLRTETRPRSRGLLERGAKYD